MSPRNETLLNEVFSAFTDSVSVSLAEGGGQSTEECGERIRPTERLPNMVAKR